MAKASGPYHVVAHHYDDELRTYSIYINNRPFVVPPKGVKLGRRAAHILCGFLNHVPILRLQEPATREELMAVRG